MFLAIDKDINNFNKGFASTSQGAQEDPTYLGFKFIFDFKPEFRSPDDFITDNALFADKSSVNLESAERYLTNIGYAQKAAEIKQFRDTLEFVNKNTPWYFQSLEGMGDIWRITKGKEFNNYRGKDKVITINCLESIDLRITALADLYRKATFDTFNMRELLPENLRWFTINILVAEMRSFQRIADTINSAHGPGNATTTNQISNDYLTQFKNVENLISVLQFTLTRCEFDFEDSFPTEDVINMGGDMVMSKQKFKIKVGRIEETNTYSLLNLILHDDKDTQESSQVNGGALSGSNTSTSNNTDFLKSLPDLGSAVNRRTNFSPLLARTNEIINNGQTNLQNAGANLVARGVNAIQSQVNNAILGNVFDLRNQSPGTIVRSFLGVNQQSAITQLGNEDVYPTVPGVDLTTKTSTNLGHI